MVSSQFDSSVGYAKYQNIDFSRSLPVLSVSLLVGQFKELILEEMTVYAATSECESLGLKRNFPYLKDSVSVPKRL